MIFADIEPVVKVKVGFSSRYQWIARAVSVFLKLLPPASIGCRFPLMRLSGVEIVLLITYHLSLNIWPKVLAVSYMKRFRK